MMSDLFDEEDTPRWREDLAPGTVLLRGFARDRAALLLSHIDDIARSAPFRQMVTPGGYRMSAAMSNCGALGWVTDESGYRYTAYDPLTGAPWPTMTDDFHQLSQQAAQQAGFSGFSADACLINRYAVGAKMSLHQDKDERDFAHPIVSVSLGLPVVFQFGGVRRSDPVQQVILTHGDVLVWGGPSRLRYHGVRALKPGVVPVGFPDGIRINLTFRRAG